MADLKKQIELVATATGVEAGVGAAKRSLADLGVAARAAGKQASDGLSNVGDAGATAAGKIDRATQSSINTIQRKIASFEAFGKSAASFQESIASQRGANLDVLKPYLASLDAAEAKSKLASAAIGAGAKQLTEYGMSARATAAALRQVPSQVTDIITSLQGGQRPLTVLLQQGGQLKDVFGGIGPAARALGGYILGLVNPFTIAAAAIGAVTYAAISGQEETTAYAKALILSGNASGATVGGLQAMARAISQVAGTQGNAAEALAQFAASGDVAAGGLQHAAEAAVVFERSTGQAIGDTVKQFSELARSPLEASLKLNDTLHYLTLSTYAQIKAFDDAGKSTDAAAAAQRAYADAIESRGNAIEQRLGTIQKLWRGIKDESARALDALLGLGREDSNGDKIKAAQQRLAQLEVQQSRSARNPTADANFDKARQLINETIAGLSRRVVLEDNIAATAKMQSEAVSAAARFDAQRERIADNRLKREKEIAAAISDGAKAGKSQDQINKSVALINEKYKDPKPSTVGLQIDKSQLNSDLDAIQKASDRLVGIFQNQEKVLEAQHAAGTLSDAQYFQKKREFIIAETEVQDYQLGQQISRAEQAKRTGKDEIDNQRRIADLESKQAKLREDASGKLAVLSTQETAAAQKLAVAFLSARQAAQDYYDTIQRQQARELASFGQGSQKRDYNAGLNQIEDRYSGQRRDLENTRAQLELDGKFNADAKQLYEQRLANINEFQDKSIASFSDYYAKRLQMEGDASLGAKEALQNYIDEASKTGKLTEQAYTNAFGSIEDALVTFTQTRQAFRSLANSIIADLARIQIKAAIASAVSSASGSGGFLGIVGGLLGAFAGSGATASLASSLPGDSLDNFFALNSNFAKRAAGGPVSAGGLYEVNERGPELLQSGGHQYLMMGSQAGNVVPNGGSKTPNINIINQTQGRIDRATQHRLSDEEIAIVVEQSRAAVAADFHDPNSRVSRAVSKNLTATRKR